ncbi:hypothetical protein ABIB17_002169 [Arthrobacter sp. UYEF6]
MVEPECGELDTSLDMSGLSRTLLWLDEELEHYWAAPADWPAYRKGNLAMRARREITGPEAAVASSLEETTPASPRCCAWVRTHAMEQTGTEPIRRLRLSISRSATLAAHSHEAGNALGELPVIYGGSAKAGLLPALDGVSGLSRAGSPTMRRTSAKSSTRHCH